MSCMSIRPGPRAFLFGDFSFHPETGELGGSGGTCRLARQPALVLRTFLEHPGELVTRAELIRALWHDGTHVDYDQSLSFCIREVRRALGDRARDPRFVETLPKRGYRFLAEVTREPGGEPGASDLGGAVRLRHTEPAGPPEVKEVTEVTEVPRRERRLSSGRPWVLAVALGGALVAGAALGHDVARSPGHDRAVSWLHGLFGLAADSCVWGGSGGWDGP
jgi:DNA-binding winged helix-turn-helix (wHTH) protein